MHKGHGSRLGFGVAAMLLGVGALVGGVPAVAQAAPVTYEDAPAIPSWAADDVGMTTQFKVFQGDDQGTFRPEAPISRAEFTAIVYRAFPVRLTSTEAIPFMDIRGTWYEDAVTRAFQAGIIRAKDYGTSYAAATPITRAEMARMVARAVDARNVIFTPGMHTGFTDVSPSHAFYKEIAKATSYGIINGVGDGSFRPGDTATRAQAAVMIGRAMRLGKPLDTDVDAAVGGAVGLNKSTKVPAYIVFQSAFELAAVRQAGTKADLTSVAQWLAPDALTKLTVITSRDIPARTTLPYMPWSGFPIRYIGEDHAVLPGSLPGVGKVDVPVQRQWDGRWIILDVPFEKIDVTQMDALPPKMITYSYTDVTGSYVGRSTGDPTWVMSQLARMNWGGGRFRVLRVNGLPYELTSFKDAVDIFHQTPDAAPVKHRWVRFNGADFYIETADTDLDFVARVSKYAQWQPMFLSVDGVKWGAFAESPYLRNLVSTDGAARPLFLDEVVRAKPDKYVPSFLQLLEQVKDNRAAVR